MTTAEKTRNTETATANIVRISTDRWLVPSRTTTGVNYLVTRLTSGSLQCDCDAAIHGRLCWHLTAVTRFEIERKADAQRSHLTSTDRTALANLLRGRA